MVLNDMIFSIFFRLCLWKEMTLPYSKYPKSFIFCIMKKITKLRILMRKELWMWMWGIICDGVCLSAQGLTEKVKDFFWERTVILAAYFIILFYFASLRQEVLPGNGIKSDDWLNKWLVLLFKFPAWQKIWHKNLAAFSAYARHTLLGFLKIPYT